MGRCAVDSGNVPSEHIEILFSLLCKKENENENEKEKEGKAKKKREERNEEEEKEKFRYQQHIGTMYSQPGEDTLAWCDV